MAESLTLYSQLEVQYELQHDKTNKMTWRPAKTQFSLGIRSVWLEPSLSAWRRLGSSLATHKAHGEDSDQIDQSWSGWSESSLGAGHYVGFVMLWLHISLQLSVSFLQKIIKHFMVLEKIAFYNWQTKAYPSWLKARSSVSMMSCGIDLLKYSLCTF